MKRLAALGALLLAACSSGGSPGGATGGTPGGLGGAPGGLGGASPGGTGGGAGGLSGTGGSFDAGIDVPDGSLGYTPSPALLAFLQQLQNLKAGQPADLDGDGFPDAIQTVNSDGSWSYQDDQDGDGTPEFVLTADGTGNVSATIDADEDGAPEQAVVYTVTAAMHQEVLTSDSDLDGTFDHRYTWTTQAATIAAQAYLEEADTAETGTFTTVTTATLTTTKNAGATCDGNDNFPSSGTDVRPFGAGGPVIKTGGGAGDCGFGDATSVANAVDCALTKGLACLSTTNSKEYNSLTSALGGRMTQLDIGCGNICSGVDASTRGYAQPFPVDSTMNINPAEWDMLDADGQCNMMLHELLHWAGDEGSADHNSPSGPGNDAVYSCGRYCGNCSHALHGSQNNSAIDCAYCADTLARKQQCGAQTQFQTGPCNGQLGGLCHAGLACIAADCDTCGDIITTACDGTPLSNDPSCCASCPATCNSSNDLPCSSSPPQSTDTCNDATPPNCN